MPMKKQLPKTTRNVLAEAIKNEVKKILREMDEASSSLSPEAEKALEQSKIAKQNKDAQKKRAAAKQSMKGISVEGVDPTVDADEDFDFETGMWTTAEEDEGSTYYPYDDDDSENPYQKGPTRTNEVEYYTEQFSRMPGDKRQSDEVDFFDTTDLHGDEGEFEGWQDPDQQDHFYPEDEFEKFAPADEPESSEYDEQEAWEWDAKMVDDEWEDWREDY